MANGIGSLLERYVRPETKEDLAKSFLVGASPAGGLLDAIASTREFSKGNYGMSGLLALGATIPFVSGSSLAKIFGKMLKKPSRNVSGEIPARLTGKEVDELFEAGATPEQVGQADRHIRFMRKYSTMGRRGSAKRRSDAPMKDTPRRIRRRERGLPEDETPRVKGRGWVEERTPKEIDPATARARQRLKEQDEALLSLDDQYRFSKLIHGSGPDQKLVLDKDWAHLWAPESIPPQVNLLRLVEKGEMSQEQYDLIRQIVAARRRNPRFMAKSPLTDEQMRSLGNPIEKKLSPGPKLPNPYGSKWERDPYFGGTPEEAMQILLDKGYDMTGYYGSALADDVGKGIMSLPITKTNLGRGSVVTTDPNLAIRYAQRGPGKGIITPLQFKSEYALPMESGPNTPLSRYFLRSAKGKNYPEDYILNKPLSVEEFIASLLAKRRKYLLDAARIGGG
jgi:hypothetical protein